jgi:CBS domain-containing protein
MVAMDVGDLMTREVVSVTETTSSGDAVALLTAHGSRRCPSWTLPDSWWEW